jgi:polyhydroxyalkanoate synthesis regulator phasin
MPVIQQMFKEAWTSARAGVNAAEQEAEKVLSRISPDEVRRTARELGERLTTQRRELGDRLVTQRRELERAFDDTVKRAVSRFKIPSRDDLDALTKRLDAISERVDALSKDKGAA